MRGPAWEVRACAAVADDSGVLAACLRRTAMVFLNRRLSCCATQHPIAHSEPEQRLYFRTTLGSPRSFWNLQVPGRSNEFRSSWRSNCRGHGRGYARKVSCSWEALARPHVRLTAAAQPMEHRIRRMGLQGQLNLRRDGYAMLLVSYGPRSPPRGQA